MKLRPPVSQALHGAMLGQSFHFPSGHGFARARDVGLEARAVTREAGNYTVTVRTARFAQAVSLDVPGYVPDDNYFHLEPGAEKNVTLRPYGTAGSLRGTAHPLNAFAPTRIAIAKDQ